MGPWDVQPSGQKSGAQSSKSPWWSSTELGCCSLMEEAAIRVKSVLLKPGWRPFFSPMLMIERFYSSYCISFFAFFTALWPRASSATKMAKRAAAAEHRGCIKPKYQSELVCTLIFFNAAVWTRLLLVAWLMLECVSRPFFICSVALLFISAAHTWFVVVVQSTHRVMKRFTRVAAFAFSPKCNVQQI